MDGPRFACILIYCRDDQGNVAHLCLSGFVCRRTLSTTTYLISTQTCRLWTLTITHYMDDTERVRFAVAGAIRKGFFGRDKHISTTTVISFRHSGSD